MYKRNEAFRYQFDPPIKGEFKLTKIGDRSIDSSSGVIYILDISQGGLKCKIPFDIDYRQDVKLSVSFSINENPLQLTGTLVWQTKRIDHFYYGVKLDSDDNLYSRLKEELIHLEQNKRKEEN